MDACNNSAHIDNTVLDKINEFLKEDTIDIEFIFDDATDAKIALLEAKVITKDMEILALKEKLKPTDVRFFHRTEWQRSINNDLFGNEIGSALEQQIPLQYHNKIRHAPNVEQCENTRLKHELSEEKRKHVANYDLLIKANKELDKIPNWIKKIATWWVK